MGAVRRLAGWLGLGDTLNDSNLEMFTKRSEEGKKPNMIPTTPYMTVEHEMSPSAHDPSIQHSYIIYSIKARAQ